MDLFVRDVRSRGYRFGRPRAGALARCLFETCCVFNAKPRARVARRVTYCRRIAGCVLCHERRHNSTTAYNCIGALMINKVLTTQTSEMFYKRQQTTNVKIDRD
jgi:hypothetical protein